MKRKPKTSDLAAFKQRVIESLAADAFFARHLVLKGGTALEIAYHIGDRASVDVDYSIEGDFSEPDLGKIESRLRAALETGLNPSGLHVFDIFFEPKPAEVSQDLAAFWGGYKLSFKVLAEDLFTKLGNDVEAHRRNAMKFGPSQRGVFEVDISRHEFCGDVESHPLGRVHVTVYSPRLIVAEKLRAICQQTPEYRKSVRSPGPRPRSRDFFDIHNLIERFSLVLGTREFLKLLVSVFHAKRVDLKLLWEMRATREFHRQDFGALRDTVPPGTLILTFDEYFDFVIRLVSQLQTLRDE